MHLEREKRAVCASETFWNKTGAGVDPVHDDASGDGISNDPERAQADVAWVCVEMPTVRGKGRLDNSHHRRTWRPALSL